jgi:mono/diheme cytochrome c family protein
MKQALVLVALALSACNKAPDQAAKGPPGGPLPIPPYQVRAELPAGNRLVSVGTGADLFSSRCGACHLAGGMGSNLLTKQMIAAKRPPSDGLLANRTDLTPDYVQSVVRNGKMAMPRLTRVDVTDAELTAIAAYLGKAKP